MNILKTGKERMIMPFIEQEVQIEGKYPLAGTLTLPNAKQEKFPVIVMVHGSGELDRDENAKGMRINAFKEFSELAASEGFAALRYDKRGIGKSEGQYLETGLNDLIDDAVQGIKFAQLHPALDENKIIVLGHSEGAIIAPAIHDRIKVQGMILLSGSAEPLGATTAWQREMVKQDMRNTTGFQGYLIRLLKIETKFEAMNTQLMEKLNATDSAIIRFKGKKVNAKWHREHEAYNVADYLPSVKCPILAVTGSKDVQVKPEQVKTICELTSGPCQAYLIQNMTHLLRKTEKEHTISAILKDYRQEVKRSVDEELKSIILKWLVNWKEGRLFVD